LAMASTTIMNSVARRSRLGYDGVVTRRFFGSLNVSLPVTCLEEEDGRSSAFSSSTRNNIKESVPSLRAGVHLTSDFSSLQKFPTILTASLKAGAFAWTNVPREATVASPFLLALQEISTTSSDMGALLIKSENEVDEEVNDWVWMSSTLKKRRAKMNKHKLKKRRKLLRRKAK
jgi:hypothetical protein